MAEDEVQSSLKKWEQIQALKFTGSSSSLRSQEGQSSFWSLVVIRDSRRLDHTIFPPANHENLHLREQQNLESSSSFSFYSSSSTSSSLSSASFSLSDDEISEPLSPLASESPVRNPKRKSGWMDFALEVIRCKFFSRISTFGSKASIMSSFGTFSSAVGVSLLVLFWLFYRRTRQRRRDIVDQLRFTIDKKDEKISHLLHQIVQLNELLLAQKKLPTST